MSLGDRDFARCRVRPQHGSRANILLVETPVAETEGTTGFPEIVAAENYVINHGPPA